MIAVSVGTTAMLAGVDVAVAVNASQWQCLAKAGVQWSVARGWHSYGAMDQQCESNLKGAAAAGIKQRDVYLFPCRGKPASEQVATMLRSLDPSTFHRVWLDVEENPSPGCSWSDPHEEDNCAFVTALALAVQSTAGVPLGVYSNHHDWNRTVGDHCILPGELPPLWYAHYDRDPSTCTDFLPFGGWSRPFAKQYSDHSASLDKACGISPDISITC